MSFGVFMAAAASSRVALEAMETLITGTVGRVMLAGTVGMAANLAPHELALAEIGKMAMSIKKGLLAAALAIVATAIGRYGLPPGGAPKALGQTIVVNSAAQQQAGAPEAPTTTISPANSENGSGAKLPSKVQSDEADKPAAERMIGKVYSLQTVDPERMMKELRALLPEAQINAVTANRMLVVTSKEDHRRVQAIVELAERQGETKPGEAEDGSLSESSSGASLRTWVGIGSGVLILLFALIVVSRKLKA